MSIELVREYLKKYNIDNRIMEYDQSSATVELAAEAAGVIPARICKSISLKTEDGAILICTAGDAKIDNRKYKDIFHTKAKMLSPDEVKQYTNHEIGGVCPFGITNSNTKVYLDISLNRFETVFPACGSSNSAVELTPDELFEISCSIEWIDACKDWQEQENE